MRKFKKIAAIGCAAMMVVSSMSMSVFAESETIPEFMPAGTILTYGENLQPNISIDVQSQSNDKMYNCRNEVASQKEIDEEEAVYQSIKEAAKEYKVTVLDENLPTPKPGMVVIYGSDGQINRVYNPENEITPFASVPNEGRALPYPSRLPDGVYTYGSYPNKITIINNHVLGEGRFTVYRPGVGGTGKIGSSGKTLVAGDVATKMSVDNCKHNTALRAKNLENSVLKTVYKNDIGSLPNAVLDVFYWGDNDIFFGCKYSDTLSFQGRYYYEY